MATTTLLENSRCKDFEYRYSNIGLVIGGSVSTLAGVSGKTSKASQPSPWAEALFLADRIEALVGRLRIAILDFLKLDLS